MADDPSMPVPEPPIVPPPKVWVLPNPGEVITSLLTNNTYVMGERIGEGSFGVVFACTDGWRNDLAAKVLKGTGRSYELVRASAEAELRKLVAHRHPNITYIFDAFEYRDTFYLITERCYFSLAELFKVEGIRASTLLQPVARCLLQAVHYLHINKLAHQDIHPGNVFASFVKDERWREEIGALQFKLGDLGVAKLFGEITAENTRAQWMLPPEVLVPAEFGPIDQRIDIYHVGLLLLQIAHGKEMHFTREEILEGRPREMALALDPPLSFALEKALRRRAQYRTATALELWRDLQTPADGDQAQAQEARQAPAGQGPGEPQ